MTAPSNSTPAMISGSGNAEPTAKGLGELETDRLIVLHSNRAIEGRSAIGSDSPEPILSTVGEALWHLYDNPADALAEYADLKSPSEAVFAAEAVIDTIHRSAARGGAIVQP